MKNVFLIFAFLIVSILLFSNVSAQNNLESIYNSMLTANLNNGLDNSKILYHLTSKKEFKKEMVEKQLKNIVDNIDDANDVLSQMIDFLPQKELANIQKYLDNIDNHLAQVNVYVESVRQDLKKEKSLSETVSKIYYEIKIAEKEDHAEIMKIRNLKVFDEPAVSKK